MMEHDNQSQSLRFRKLYPLQILLCFLISHSYMAAKCQQSPLKNETQRFNNTTIHGCLLKDSDLLESLS